MTYDGNTETLGAGEFPPALPFVAQFFAEAFAPPIPFVPSEWAAANLRIVLGPRPGPWDPLLTPYVPPIIDLLGPDSPHNLVVVEKSAQTGLSVAGLALAAGYAACRPNTAIGYALPTIDLMYDFARDRLTPTIAASPALRRRVREQVSRAGDGSTAFSKKFEGGNGELKLINANSAADLRAKTLQVGIGDEVDQWARDLSKQGDPWELFQNRFISFHATGEWKVLALSTPTLEGGSRIHELYEAGDQRQWHIKCPHCETAIVLKFKHLLYERKPPYRAHYAAQCCGGIIEHYQKAMLVRFGEFLPTNPVGGLYPSFHIDALISQLTTWDKVAEKAIAAEKDERQAMAFHNTWLGVPYAVKGDAPDWQRLFTRREDYAENTIPPLGLLLVAGADVQHSGIWVEIVAYAPDRQSWTVSARFLEGDTTDPNLGAFAALASVYDETFPDAYGNRRRIQRMAIDAGDGGRANQIYAFARQRYRMIAVKGVAGWAQPAIAGQPTRVSITLNGQRLKGGGTLWPVGTWPLKAEIYDQLRKNGRRAGAELDPPGYVHHGTFIGEQYFRQLTAESLQDVKVRGHSVKQWVDHGPNHFLDCRVYAMAAAEQMGLTRKTRSEWLAIARLWSMPGIVDDLFAPPELAVERGAAGVAAATASAAPAVVTDDAVAGVAEAEAPVIVPSEGPAADLARALAGKSDPPRHQRRVRVRHRGFLQ